MSQCITSHKVHDHSNRYCNTDETKTFPMFLNYYLEWSIYGNFIHKKSSLFFQALAREEILANGGSISHHHGSMYRTTLFRCTINEIFFLFFCFFFCKSKCICCQLNDIWVTKRECVPCARDLGCNGLQQSAIRASIKIVCLHK